jgi:hypothetical protein
MDNNPAYVLTNIECIMNEPRQATSLMVCVVQATKGGFGSDWVGWLVGWLVPVVVCVFTCQESVCVCLMAVCLCICLLVGW